MIPRQPDYPQPDPPKTPRSGLVPALGPPRSGQVSPALRAHVRARIAQEQARLPIWTWLTHRTVPAWTAVVAVGLLLVVGMQLWRGLQQGQPSLPGAHQAHPRPWTSSVLPDACTPIGSRPGSHMPPRSALWVAARPVPSVPPSRGRLYATGHPHGIHSHGHPLCGSRGGTPRGRGMRPPHCGWRSCSRP